MTDLGTTPAPATTPPPQSQSLDRQDERLSSPTDLRGSIQAFGRRVRAGDLGALPVVIGLVIIWTAFQLLNPVFLSSNNLVNLSLELVPVGVIALGIVTILVVAQIDLSVGSVSGLAAAVLGVLWVREGWPVWLGIAAALAAAALIGGLYSVLFNRFGVPSFVATLAGLLAFLGLQLYLLGDQGSINLPFESGLVRFATLAFVPAPLAYLLAALVPAAMLVAGLTQARRRRAAGLSARSLPALLIRSALVLLALEVAVWYLNQSRGVGWMLVLFAALVLAMQYALTRTRWGRSAFAVGGNVEAARRAGINVRRVFTSVFITCSTLAALGGVLAAARLASANTSSGTGDVNLNAIAAAVIGGTSLFGGRGSAYSALLGIIVIQSISSGLTLLNLSSSFRFMITGLVLALAVGVDSLARKSRTSHGQA
jgi:D-xylose transport system permease protein